jgi:TolB protein
MQKLLPFIISVFVTVPVFSATRTISFERDNAIWISNIDGTEARKIADGNLPDISPDASRVAFTTDESEQSPIRHIAVIDLSSLKITVFKSIPSDNSFGPVWSPDGKSLLFSAYMDGDWQLALVKENGTEFRVVKKAAKENASFYMPSWAPDGQSFFCHDLDFIYQFALDGTLIKKWEIHSILDHGDMNSNSRIDVSPDRQSLIMDIDMDEDNDRENWDGPPPAVWVLPLNETRAIRLTKRGFFAWDPHWISNDEYLFIAQGEKEDLPSIYRGSRTGAPKLLIKNGRGPGISR